MNMKKYFQIIFALFFLQTNAQTNVGTASSLNNNNSTSSETPGEISGFQGRMMRRGLKFFEYKEYAEAIPYFEKALTGNESNKQLVSSLAECYRLTNNIPGQISCYENLVKNNQADQIHHLYYGEALMETGEYDKAKQQLKNYKADNRGNMLVMAIDKRASYKKNADCFEVNIAPFNSTHDDYCAVKFYDATVFASTRNKTSWIKKEQGWTNENYLQMYKTDGTADNVKPFIGDLQSKFNDGPISFTKDFSTIFFARNHTKKNQKSADGEYKLTFLEASMDMNGFANERTLPFVKPDYNYTHPSISPDGLTLFFSSDMPGGAGGMDLYICTKDSFGVWSEPRNLGPTVNTAGSEVFPFIAANGILYFSSIGRD
jgi:tetratricopeptide (TPR) repeat protein